MNPLEKRFFAEEHAFIGIRKLCESKIVRWDYWQWPQWYWDPDLVLGAPGKPKRAPKDKARFAYGYDDEGRVTVIHQFSQQSPRELDSMQLLRYSGNKIIGSQVQQDMLADVFEASLSEGRIVRVEHFVTGIPPWDWKTLEWQGGKIAKITYGLHARKAHREVTYDKASRMTGEIGPLDPEESKAPKPLKRKPLPKGVTMQSLAKQIRERLARTVVTTVAKAKVREPVYCLALNYDCEGNPLLLPELGIGLDSERQVRLKARSREAKLAIWQPEEFSLFANDRTALQGRDRELDRACDLFNRELEYKGSDQPARKLILQVAADLAKVDWSGKLNTTDDFIVYAVDTYGNDLRKNLKLSVPPKQLAKLKAAKLL